MDGSGVIQGHVHAMSSQRRPQTQQSISTNFRRLSVVNETRNYIMITQDMLDAFKERVVKSHKVDLTLNHVHLKSSVEPLTSKRHLPPLSSDRLRLIHTKAQTSLDLREYVRNRPVKVFIDDITKHGVGTKSRSRNEPHNVVKGKQPLMKTWTKLSGSIAKR